MLIKALTIAGGLRRRENRGREAGSGIYMRAGGGSKNKEGDSLLFITGVIQSKTLIEQSFEISI